MCESTLQTRVLETFKYLHRNGELSWEEKKTTKYITRILQDNNCKTKLFEDCTGVIGEYGQFKKDLPVVGIRADMDALYQEVDGAFKANHSCGHDAHMAIVLGLLWKLEQEPFLKDQLALTFIFQPAEEVGTGALKMIENGVITNMDYLYGVHLRPKQETQMNRASPVIIHGAAKSIHATIVGEDAHAARPHLTSNAIEVGAQIINMIQHIHLDPNVPYSVKMTTFQAGGKNTNIIPGNAKFSLDLRTQNNDQMEELLTKLESVFNSIKMAYSVDIKVDSRGIAAARVSDDAVHIMSQAIISVLGKEQLDPPLITPGGDDFHFYTIKKPSLQATMLGLGSDLQPGLHHPHMTFNHDALMNGVHILYEAVLQTYGIK